jgi:hypothetical protein
MPHSASQPVTDTRKKETRKGRWKRKRKRVLKERRKNERRQVAFDEKGASGVDVSLVRQIIFVLQQHIAPQGRRSEWHTA